MIYKSRYGGLSDFVRETSIAVLGKFSVINDPWKTFFLKARLMLLQGPVNILLEVAT